MALATSAPRFSYRARRPSMTRRTRHAALRRPGRRRRRRNPTSSHWGVAAVRHSVPQCGVAASTCSTGPRAPRAGVDSRRGLARVGLPRTHAPLTQYESAPARASLWRQPAPGGRPAHAQFAPRTAALLRFLAVEPGADVPELSGARAKSECRRAWSIDSAPLFAPLRCGSERKLSERHGILHAAALLLSPPAWVCVCEGGSPQMMRSLILLRASTADAWRWRNRQ